MDWLRGIGYGIGNICAYARILWSDRDWDWTFMLVLMRLKLSRMRRAIENGMSCSGPRVAKTIHTCELLMERIVKDEYCVEEWKKLDQRWGNTTWTDTLHTSVKAMSRENIKTDRDHELYIKELIGLLQKEDHMAKQDIELLFDLMKKHIRTWWD